MKERWENGFCAQELVLRAAESNALGDNLHNSRSRHSGLPDHPLQLSRELRESDESWSSCLSGRSPNHVAACPKPKASFELE